MFTKNQHYPPGTQEKYNSFSSRNLIIGKGKELEFSEERGGGKGEPGVPPTKNLTNYSITKSPFGFSVITPIKVGSIPGFSNAC